MTTKAAPDVTPFQKFKDFTRKLLAVPKAEVDAKEKQLKRNKARRVKSK